MVPTNGYAVELTLKELARPPGVRLTRWPSWLDPRLVSGCGTMEDPQRHPLHTVCRWSVGMRIAQIDRPPARPARGAAVQRTRSGHAHGGATLAITPSTGVLADDTRAASRSYSAPTTTSTAAGRSGRATKTAAWSASSDRAGLEDPGGASVDDVAWRCSRPCDRAWTTPARASAMARTAERPALGRDAGRSHASSLTRSRSPKAERRALGFVVAPTAGGPRARPRDPWRRPPPSPGIPGSPRPGRPGRSGRVSAAWIRARPGGA